MQRDKRDTVFWHNSASKSNIGPGFYEYDDKAPRSVSFNFGKVPFWSRKQRFNIRERLFPTPGPGHYSVKNSGQSHLSNNVKWSVSKVERFNSEKGKAFRTAPLNSQLQNTALANWEDDMPPKKPKPVVKNDKSFKDSKSSQILRQILHGTTPSIPYSKFNSTENTLPQDDKIGPGFYKPKFNLVEKKVSVAKLTKEKKTENPRKNMEQFINNVILDDVYSQRFSKAVKAIASAAKETKPVTFRKMSEPEENTALKNGIFQTELSRQSFIFKSKTKKIELANQTPVPGPGQYMLNTKHEIFKKLPQNFGSSEPRDPVWMRANGSRAPYFKASAIETPGVGSYHLQKTRGASLGKSERLFGYQRRSTATDKLESAVRSAIINGGIQKAANVVTEGKLKQKASQERFRSPSTETPGPGSYYIPSQTDINLVEFKYNPKYRDAPFGNRTPRFKGRLEKEIADEPVETDKMSKVAQSSDTNEPLRLNRVPSSLSRQESYIFKSNVERFVGGAFDGGPRSQSTVPPERPDLSDDLKTEKERPRIKLRKQHEEVSVPFGVSTPRKFDYMKISENTHLGPGVYAELDSSINSKPVLKGEVTFKKEKRWKEEREEDIGPGIYYTPTTMLKRTYNTSLPPPKQYILKQNIQL